MFKENIINPASMIDKFSSGMQVSKVDVDKDRKQSNTVP